MVSLIVSSGTTRIDEQLAATEAAVAATLALLSANRENLLRADRQMMIDSQIIADCRRLLTKPRPPA